MSGAPLGSNEAPSWPSFGRRFDKENIQSEVLFGYAREPGDSAPSRGAYVLLRFPRSAEGAVIDGQVAQRFLKKISITWAQERPDDGVYVNVGLTYSGMKALVEVTGAARESVLGSIGKPFEELAETMAARAELLGDTADSAPSYWEFSDGTAREGGFGGIDAVVMIYQRSVAPTDDGVTARARAIEDEAGAHGCTWLRKECEALAEDREHFGYVDGLVQPAIEGLPGPVEGYGKVDASGYWRKVRMGELVLGFEDEAGPFGGNPLLEDGSFFVLRKLEQDVRGFHGFLGREAERLGRDDVGAAELAAWLMGRDFDGKALIANGGVGFRYAADPDGTSCPFGAHIRRVNPRDTSGRVAERSERHRLVRRSLMFTEDPEGRFEPEGRSFGARLRADPALADDRARGMLFGCFVASIGRQFEVVQGAWLNGGESAPRKLFTRDPIAGANHAATGDFIVPGRPITVLCDVPQFTTTRGGAYFFIPGRAALQFLLGMKAESAVESATLNVPGTFDLVTRFSRALRERRVPPAGSSGRWEVSQIVGATERAGGPSARGAVRQVALSIFEPRASVRALVDRWRDGQTGVPEQQVLVVMAPIKEGLRPKVEEVLAQRAPIDAALERVTCTHHRDGVVPSLHHARFLITSRFYRYGPQTDLNDEPDHVPLARGEAQVPFLFFACWFDGSRSELLRGLAAQGGALPFVHCNRFPERPEEEPESFASRMCGHEIPMLFAYQAYPASTHRIRRALTLRERFVHLIAELSSASPDESHIEGFFRDWVAEGAQRTKRAK